MKERSDDLHCSFRVLGLSSDLRRRDVCVVAEPVFLFYGFTRWSPWSFHLSFWTGLGLGLLLAAGLIPATWAIGEGKYALLLGVNAYGFLICTAGFFLPIILRRLAGRPLAAGEA